MSTERPAVRAETRRDDLRFVVKTAFVVAGVAILVLVGWQLTGVALLFFGAVLVATALRSLAGLIEKVAPLPSPWSLLVAVLLILAIGAAASVFLGAQLADQGGRLLTQLPDQIAGLGERFGIPRLDERAAEQAQAFAERGSMLQSVAGYTSGALGALTNLVLVLVGGVYLAARPDFYLKGALSLFPDAIRPNVSRAAGNAGRALRLWLLGQLFSMVLVGGLCTLGLWALGVPSAIVLGLIAGLAEFVPVVGPIVGALPALVVALSVDGSTFLWVLGLYLLVQQIESNVIMPLVQRRTVDLPPVLALFGLLPLAVLFGPIGVLFGTPLTVVIYVMVKQLYLRDTLNRDVAVPGEEKPG